MWWRGDITRAGGESILPVCIAQKKLFGRMACGDRASSRLAASGRTCLPPQRSAGRSACVYRASGQNSLRLRHHATSHTRTTYMDNGDISPAIFCLAFTAQHCCLPRLPGYLMDDNVAGHW